MHGPVPETANDAIIINPMKSTNPTGMGVAGDGFQNCFLGSRDRVADRVFRFINDKIAIGSARMFLRQVAADFFAWKHRNKLVIFSTHQGPLIRHGKFIVVIHDFITFHHPFQNRVQTMGFLFLLPRIVRNSARVVVISNHVKKDLLRYLPGVRQESVRVIPSLSARVNTFSEGGIPWRKRLERGRFLFVGANYRHKRLDVAILAILELQNKGWKVGLDIVGVKKDIWEKSDGFDFAMLEKRGIVAKAYVADADLESLYSESCGLLFLSECEGLGFPPLEALRKHCPAICNDTSELRDTCGDAAFYVDIAKVGRVLAFLEELMSGRLDLEVKEKIQSGNKQLARFEKSCVVRQWFDVIRELRQETK